MSAHPDAVAAVRALARGQCRFSFGDPKEAGFRFCKAKAVNGSWCREHRALCSAPLQTPYWL